MVETLRVLLRLLWRAAYELVEPFQSVTGFSIFAAVVFLWGAGLLWARKGPDAVRLSFSDLAQTVPPLILALVTFFAWNVARITYKTYSSQKTELRENDARIRELDRQLQTALHQKRHVFDRSEPAYENAWGLTVAFWRWRQAINDPTAQMLITTDSDAGPIASQFWQYAVTGSGLTNGTLRNIGIRPEDEDEIVRAASVPDTVVIHAYSETKEFLTLYSAI